MKSGGNQRVPVPFLCGKGLRGYATASLKQINDSVNPDLTRSRFSLDESLQSGSLGSKLRAALASRETRSIRRRLPEPSVLGKQSVVDFTSNDYLSLSTSPLLRARFLQKISEEGREQILGSAGSRLLVNPDAHDRLERRIETVLSRPCQERYNTPQVGLLFNSGFDANVSFFTCIPQPGDVIILDEYIHASVWDGVRASRVEQRQCVKTFEHNSVDSLRLTLESLLNGAGSSTLENHSLSERLRQGTSSVFVAVESLYSMDGTLAPLREINTFLDDLFPRRNGYLVVDEAHATGIYGPPGRPGCGRVSQLGLDGGLGSQVGVSDRERALGQECRVLARLHTFGKALAGSGAIFLTTPLLNSYLINFARPLIYTTALAHPNVVLAEAAFDLMVEGKTEPLSKQLLFLSSHLVSKLQTKLKQAMIPPDIVSLPAHLLPSPTTTKYVHPPTPIIPLLTPHPRPLSARLYSLGMNARPITWPTVPRGKERVRVCLHAGNTSEQVEALVNGVVEWALELLNQAERSKL
ncbi:hypothetical protein D9757_003800 [Collybiopsis confluens]|uniref:Aminotransferase class I/classII large domain-containing protein n=1 Tax=Collybiopsis confluens TaxID=2823264 RepID=A0A8H5HV67_9AGAR|nr:hypothetical protein D9757_003800 [Collybiopsis confluens]